MKIKYIYSACQKITVGDYTLLIDPWLQDGAFYGSWCLAYEPAEEALAINPNAIWVSHIHPDHYSPESLKAVSAPLMITEGSRFLEKVAERDGFIVSKKLPPVWTELASNLSVLALQYDDIDSVLLVKSAGSTVLFAVDTPIDEEFATKIKEAADGPIDLAYLPYAGAGAWPQCYRMDGEQMFAEAHDKQGIFLAKTVIAWKRLGQPATVLYAGEYLLGGRLMIHNYFRGNPTREEAHGQLSGLMYNLLQVMPGGTVELVDGRCAIIETGEQKFREPAIELKFLYDGKFEDIDIKSFPIIRTVEACAKRMHAAKARFTEIQRQELDPWSIVLIVDNDTTFEIKLADGSVTEIRRDQVNRVLMRLEIYVTTPIFLSAAVSMTHWNNLEIGSHLRFRRVPQLYLKSLHRLLSFFHI